MKSEYYTAMSERILVIDDEPHIRETLADILDLHGFRVLYASNGKEGIEVAEQCEPDLIICDIMMPEMDGYEVASYIRSIDRMAGTPFIFLSARAAPGDFRKGMGLGADDYLTKPFSVQDVLETINTRLSRMKLLTTDALKWKDSARYAKRIQEVILPSEDQMNQLFKDHFSVYQSRDIVSGDFYWVHSHKNKTYIAVADCTGHGVPGALLSMICYEKLNAVVAENPGLTPAQILIRVNELLGDFMLSNQNRVIMKDGMDVSLCMIDQEQGEVTFSGAARPVYYVSDGLPVANGSMVNHPGVSGKTLSEIKGDLQSIGVSNKNHKFAEHRIPIKAGDRIYLFSDGFVDQFGGPKAKKIMPANFRNAILESANRPMHEQKQHLLDIFNNWKGNLEQTDDLTIVGLQL